MRGRGAGVPERAAGLPYTFFHNEFGRQIEYVGLDLIPELLPNLTPSQQYELEQFCRQTGL